ncbi:MAG: hypothetical protein KKG47_00860 [Proteobacteria bacterium]|nr:hypothetical protein [Pseudomonadota bacterium]MBU1738948.1 hypothetical protein [Pseudomonadota bacterium]
MSAKRIITIGLMGFMLSGCGQLVSEKLAVNNRSAAGQCPDSHRLVIMPFADYSYESDIEKAYRRNIKIMENLTDNLVANNFQVPVREDLVMYLANNRLINAKQGIPSQNHSTKNLQREMSSDWSLAMKAELANLINAEQAEGSKESNLIALDKQAIAKIGNDFNAAVILRGRIVKMELDEENTWRPLKKGLLPVIFDGTSRGLFGVTNSEMYDTLGAMAVGAGAGALAGDNATNPYSSADKINPSRGNSMVWGIGGAALGYLSSQGGKANMAVIQLRLIAQRADTGDVIWTNSIEVKVTPQTIFAETKEEKLMDTAIQKAVAALAKDFVSKYAPNTI